MELASIPLDGSPHRLRQRRMFRAAIRPDTDSAQSRVLCVDRREQSLPEIRMVADERRIPKDYRISTNLRPVLQTRAHCRC